MNLFVLMFLFVMGVSGYWLGYQNGHEHGQMSIVTSESYLWVPSNSNVYSLPAESGDQWLLTVTK